MIYLFCGGQLVFTFAGVPVAVVVAVLEVAGDLVSTFLVVAVSVFLSDFLAYFLLQVAQWTVVSEISNIKFLQLGHFKVVFLGEAVIELDVLERAETVVVEALGGVAVAVVVVVLTVVVGVGIEAVGVEVVVFAFVVGEVIEFLPKVGVFFKVLVITVFVFLSALGDFSVVGEVASRFETLRTFGVVTELEEVFKVVVGAMVKGLGLGPLAEALACTCLPNFLPQLSHL